MNQQQTNKNQNSRMLSVLYLEESDFAVENLRAAFDGEGFEYELKQVQSPEEFITAIRRQPYDVVLADHALPALGASEILKLVKEFAPGTPVIFLVEKIDKQFVKEIINRGAAEVVQTQKTSQVISAIRQSMRTAELASSQMSSQPYEQKIKLYREIIEKSRIPIIQVDKDGYLKFYNDRFLHLFNIKKENVQDVTIKHIVHEDDYEQFKKICDACLQGKCVPIRYEFHGKKSDGTLMQLEADISEIRINAKPVGVSVLMWDVSGRSKMEEVLKQQITIERIISQISADFINLPLDRIEHEISRAFDRIRQATLIPETSVYSLTSMEEKSETERVQDMKSREQILTQLQGTMLEDIFLKALKRKDVEEALIKKQRKYKNILESAQDCIFAKDLDGKYIYVNRQMAELLNRPEDDIIGFTDEQFMSRDAWQKEMASDAKVFNGDIIETEEKKRLGNKEHIFHIIKSPIRNVVDGVTGLCGIARILYPNSTSDQAFNVGLNILNTLIEQMPDPIFIKDEKGNYVFCNEPCMKLFEVSGEDEVLKKTDYDFYPRDYAEKLQKEEQELLRTGKPILDSEVIDNSGKKWRSMTKFPLYDKENRITGIIGIIREFPDVKKAYVESRQPGEMEKSSLKAAKTGVISWFPKSGEMIVDQVVEDLLGLRKKDELRDFDQWMRHVHPEDRKMFLESTSAYKKRKSEQLHFEFRMVHVDGSIHWFFMKGRFEVHDEARSDRFLGIVTDIGDLKKGEGSIKSLKEKYQRIKGTYVLKDIVAESEEMKKIAERIHRVAKTDASVLIIGESGTGKELIARNLHFLSYRKKQPFVPIDCVALPPTLLESEIFGYEQGAFTGATKAKPGMIELSNRGTLFLDEITELDFNLQAKLLRLIQERKFRRVGGTKTKGVDIRIISATNRNPETAIKEKKLREDLYYRLNVVPIVIPPLRERKEDIPVLVYHFIEKYNPTCAIEIKGITKHAMNRLKKYDWPGNIRELQNTIHHAMSLSDDDTIDVSDLPEAILGTETSEDLDYFKYQNFKEAKQRYLDQFTKKYFDTLLNKYKGNISKVARIAGVNRKTIYRLYNQTEE
ncbi:MAG: sigma 54-interacting transcriptional regulator [candidate division KSB1 bacterium]|jgi:PAS domain S-box-containing protein|nr:sigma 54-interacting transcriptional regulator [candidate division KSB1 bacterium]